MVLQTGFIANGVRLDSQQMVLQAGLTAKYVTIKIKFKNGTYVLIPMTVFNSFGKQTPTSMCSRPGLGRSKCGLIKSKANHKATMKACFVDLHRFHLSIHRVLPPQAHQWPPAY